MAKLTEKKVNVDVIDTLIGKDCYIKGEVEVKSSIRIEGKVEGNIRVGGMLTVGSSGYIKGDVRTNELMVGGEATGVFEVNGKAELKSGCKFYGKIRCKGIVIEEGAQFDGICATTERGKKLFEQTEIPLQEVPPFKKESSSK